MASSVLLFMYCTAGNSYTINCFRPQKCRDTKSVSVILFLFFPGHASVSVIMSFVRAQAQTQTHSYTSTSTSNNTSSSASTSTSASTNTVCVLIDITGHFRSDVLKLSERGLSSQTSVNHDVPVLEVELNCPRPDGNFLSLRWSFFCGVSHHMVGQCSRFWKHNAAR